MTKRKFLTIVSLALSMAVLPWTADRGQAAYGPVPGVDYNMPNYANSPLPTVTFDAAGNPVITGGIRKFVNSLPGLTAAGANNIGQYIPVATPDTTSFPGSDYYEIALVEYTEQMHSDLPATKLRGYVQEVNGVAVDNPHYLGPLIIAQAGRPVRIKFTNRLPVGAGGKLFLPVDTTIMGAGTGPLGGSENYTENRATLHLHGGNTPWISDGTPHQWITPAGETTSYPKGVSQRNVPDMPVPSDGSATFYYTNQQSGRLLFYHDHAYGITRLNVYGGEAAGYLITDPVERGLTPGMPEVPLVIQDKTFVPDAAQLAATDPLWDSTNWGGTGNLWFPHVWMPNQDPTAIDGSNPLGRWDYGPWFWPVFPATKLLPAATTLVPEAFMDTPIVNGTAYPYVEVQPQAYRLRILNACNDRMLNLQLYQATSIVSNVSVTTGGSGYTSAPVVTISGGGGTGATASATVDLDPASATYGQVTGVTVNTVGSGYTSAPLVSFTGGGGSGVAATAVVYSNPTEVGMVPFVPGTWPSTWGTPDARDGGVPDPATAGPAIIQIGNEGGILPNPALIENTPVGYDYNRRSITVLNVLEHGLYMGPAERADVIVDFSQYAGKTLILYNDSPAPVPAFDPRYDYYTGDPDNTPTGGAPTTQAGMGPNTRTVMQIRVAGTPNPALAPTNAYDPNTLASMQTALPGAFAATQPPMLVPSGVYARIQDTTLNGQTMHPKAIAEEFDPVYGRMNATLGVEMPFTTVLIQTTIPYFYIDPPTEILKDGETQIWKITHNGVDTHAIHFHLVNAQLINRVGWDGAVKPPDANELGWKDTIKMNPLEDIIVAVQAIKQDLPWELPNSVRPMDVTQPVGGTLDFTGVDPTNEPAPVTNQEINFGWEYVWHCHLLGHEENDMMRPFLMAVAPNAPTTLAAVALTSPLRVSLTWQDHSGNETNFTVDRATDSGFTAGLASFKVGANATSYTDNSVASGATYFYRVTANNVVGYTQTYAAPAVGYPTTSADSTPSNTVSVTVASAPPPVTLAAPSNLRASLISTNYVILAWNDNSNNEQGFYVERSTNGGATWTRVGQTAANSTIFRNTGLTTGTNYMYRVQAFNAGGVSTFSNTLSVTTR